MAHRGVFALATIMMVLFFLASHYDNPLFLLHFLEAVMYAVILILLFYGLEEWAYVMSILTPAVWTVLTLLSGTLAVGLIELGRLVTFQEVYSGRGVVVGIIFLVGLVLIVVSARAFWRQVWGRPGIMPAVVGSVVAVAAYYAVVIWVWLRLLEPAGS
jgi:hypothetical protein